MCFLQILASRLNVFAGQSVESQETRGCNLQLTHTTTVVNTFCSRDHAKYDSRASLSWDFVLCKKILNTKMMASKFLNLLYTDFK